jgi:hypothetical protein
MLLKPGGGDSSPHCIIGSLSSSGPSSAPIVTMPKLPLLSVISSAQPENKEEEIDRLSLTGHLLLNSMLVGVASFSC